MICKKCGAVVEENDYFCANCGVKVKDGVEQVTYCTPIPPIVQPVPPVVAASTTQQIPPVVTASVASPTPSVLVEKNTRRPSILGFLVGTILIIIGLVKVFSAGVDISSASFGGDFYTYTYRGIVAISEQLASIQSSLGWVVVAIGTAIDVYSLRA